MYEILLLLALFALALIGFPAQARRIARSARALYRNEVASQRTLVKDHRDYRLVERDGRFFWSFASGKLIPVLRGGDGPESPIEELRTKVATLKTEIEALADKETLTEEEEARFEPALGEFDLAKADLAKAEERAAKVAEVRATSTELVPGTPEFQLKRSVDTAVDPTGLSRSETRSVALKIVEERGQESLAPRQLDNVDKLLRMTNSDTDGGVIAKLTCYTENEHYRSAFLKAMTESNPVFTQEEARAVNAYRKEFRAMNEGTGSAGGFGIPVNQAA
jgi:hypothetical protein